MLRLFIVFRVLLVCTSQTGRASAHCDVINTIERLQFAQYRLSAQTNSAQNALDWALITDHIARLDAASISVALAQHTNRSDSDFLVGYITKSTEILGLFQARQASQLRRFFASADFARTQAHLRVILPQYRCNSLQKPGQVGGSEIGQAKTPQRPLLPALTLQPSLFWLVLCLLGGSTLLLGVRFLRRWHTRKVRLAKRFAVFVTTQVKIADMTTDTTVLDISRNGMKFKLAQTATLDDTTTGDIYLADAWRGFRVTWQTDHYRGARFATPLTRAELRQLRGFRARNTPVRTKTAPARAPLSE